MYGLQNWQFWFQLVWFFMAISLSWYVPGSVVLRRFSLKPSQHYLLSLILGLVLWGFQAYVLGYLQFRWLSYGYLLVWLLLFIPQWRLELDRAKALISHFRRSYVPLIALILFGSLIQLLQVFPTGLLYQSGVGFFGVNAYDGTLHLAFIQALVDRVPAQQPGAVGLSLSNYHYWSDLIAADLVRVWHLSITHLFFQYVPLFLSVGTGLVVWLVVADWKGSRSTIFWSLVMLYLAADVAYLFTLILHQSWGAHVAAIDNGATQLLNIPHGYAKLVFLTSLLPLRRWFQQKSLSWGCISIILLASLVGLKVYFGIFSAIGVSLVGLALFLKLAWRSRFNVTKLIPAALKLTWFWLPLLVFVLAAMAIYFPANRNSGGLLWAPLEWPKLFLGRDHIDWEDWWLRKQVYDEAGNLKATLFMDGIGIAICLLSVFGLRLAGLFPNLYWYRRIGWQLSIFFIPTSVLFILLGLYTLQVSGLFNVFNFFAVAAVPLALSTGYLLDWLWRKPLIFKLIPLIVVALGLPRIWLVSQQMVVVTHQQHFERVVSPNQLAAYQYLRENTPSESLIQTHPRNEFDRKTPATAYFSHRATYLTGISMLESHNQPIANRKAELESLFRSTNEADFYQGLSQRHIDYLYLEKQPEQSIPVNFPSPLFSVVFENDQTLIIQID